MGKAALEGLDGVKKVTRSWRGSMEINRVSYDPTEISIEDMEKVLEKAGTYRETITGE